MLFRNLSRTVLWPSGVHRRLFRSGALDYTNLFRTLLQPKMTQVSEGACHFPSPRPMSTKPVVRSPTTLRILLSSAMAFYGSPEIALLHILKTYDFDTSVLPVESVLNEYCIDIDFSKVQYQHIAPFVGLRPSIYGDMNDIKTFVLHRSRIPTALFKSIVQDMDAMKVLYVSPLAFEGKTETASSLVLSPIFNRLIPVFGSAIRNLPKSTKDSMKYYFETEGSVAVLFIKLEDKIGNYTERLDAIAQVIAECIVQDRNNQQYFRVPVYGILCLGNRFRFFLFDGTSEPFSFKHGLCPIAPQTLGPVSRAVTPLNPFELPYLEPRFTCHFLVALRQICETIFDLLLSGYVSSLKAYHNDSVNKTTRGLPREDVDKWEEAITFAVKALEGFRNAEKKRQIQLIDEANSTAEEAMTSLKHSIDVIPVHYRRTMIMNGWDHNLWLIEKE